MKFLRYFLLLGALMVPAALMSTPANAQVGVGIGIDGGSAMLDTEITATGILLRSARGATTTTIPTHAPLMDTMDRAGLSAVSSSAPAPGTTVTGVAVATTAAAATTVAVDTTDAADITAIAGVARAIAVGSGTRATGNTFNHGPAGYAGGGHAFAGGAGGFHGGNVGGASGFHGGNSGGGFHGGGSFGVVVASTAVAVAADSTAAAVVAVPRRRWWWTPVSL